MPKKVTVNELTFVCSAFALPRFINGETISGNPFGLKIAARNTPNLVDPVTGNYDITAARYLSWLLLSSKAAAKARQHLISSIHEIANIQRQLQNLCCWSDGEVRLRG